MRIGDFTTIAAALSLLFLAACGGGAGGGSIPITNPGPVDPGNPPQQPIGVLGTSNLPSAERVVEYLQIHASGGPWTGADGEYGDRPGLVRFASPPTLHLAEGATSRERAITLYAVALINRALPYDWHLRIGSDVPAGRAHQWQQGLPYIPDGQIFIEWHRQSATGRASPAVGHQDRLAVYDNQQGRWENKRLRASAVEMDSDFFDGRPDYQAVSVMVHELLHGLGFRGHVPCGSYSDSNMCNSWFRLDGSLPDIDIAALQALFLKLSEDTEPEDLSFQGLGAWNDESTEITGELGPVAFGVRHANDVSVPFSAGTEPSTRLAESGLSGMVTWRGQLLGFTPELRTVAGDASVGVNLATMRGTVKFTNLRSFSERAAPMPRGGTTWGDGALDYDIRVASNFLYSTGGGAGVVSGSFYGDNHGHVGGTVERSDLTAAFGGAR